MKTTRLFFKDALLLFSTWIAAIAFVDLVQRYSSTYLDGLGPLYVDAIFLAVGLIVFYWLKYKR